MKTPDTADWKNNGFSGRITGQESWDDDGRERDTLSVLVTCPDGSTYGYFAPNPDSARASFFTRTAPIE